MDITSVFGTAVGGSNPSGSTDISDEAGFCLEKNKSSYIMLRIEMRAWFSGRTRPCQGRDGSSILPARTN